jgi:hypothetical protein
LDLGFIVIVVLQLRFDGFDVGNFTQNRLFFGKGHARRGALEFKRSDGGEREGLATAASACSQSNSGHMNSVYLWKRTSSSPPTVAWFRVAFWESCERGFAAHR